MTVGTLRDQVIYPDSEEEQKKKNKVSDADLEDILKKVQLEYILEREKGWDTVNVCYLCTVFLLRIISFLHVCIEHNLSSLADQTMLLQKFRSC